MFRLLVVLTTAALAAAWTSTSAASVGCDLSDARIQVPVNQTQLVAPDYAPRYIGIGVGTQNYTCNLTSSTYS